jgi:hypothetical protein
VLIIDAELTAPPSEVVLFRDITLFSHVFLGKNVVLECKRSERDFYYKWLKDKCAWDYVEDFVVPRTVNGWSIRPKNANLELKRIDYSNLSLIIDKLNILSHL